jgi:hypothetical protein
LREVFVPRIAPVSRVNTPLALEGPKFVC